MKRSIHTDDFNDIVGLVVMSRSNAMQHEYHGDGIVQPAMGPLAYWDITPGIITCWLKLCKSTRQDGF